MQRGVSVWSVAAAAGRDTNVEQEGGGGRGGGRSSSEGVCSQRIGTRDAKEVSVVERGARDTG